MLLFMSAGAFAGGFSELQEASAGLPEARLPVFEAVQPVKQTDYNFRCLAGPQTPQYMASMCYLYTSKGQQACVNSGCSWGFGGTPMPDYSFRCMAASYTPQYIASTCYLYTAQGQQVCVNSGCAWGMGSNPLPAFHCAAGSFTPQYIASTCYLYTGRGQQACVNSGCSWTFSRSMNKKTNNQQNMALRKIHEKAGVKDDELIARIAKGTDLATVAKELSEGGFKVEVTGGDAAGDLARVNVAGSDTAGKASEAVGLAKYYYVTEVQVSKLIYETLFAVPN